MDCFEPGRIIVSPGPESVRGEQLFERLRAELGGDVEFDFGIEDVLIQNKLEVDDKDRSQLPFVVRVPEGLEDDLSTKMRQFPRWMVNAALPDYNVRPNVPAISINQHAVDQALQDIGGTARGRCGHGCSVAIIDSGVDPALVPTIARQYDALSPVNAPRNPFDLTGHGSLVATIVAAIAPGANIVPIRAFDSTGALSNALAALYIAKALGCQVINMSFSLSCSPTQCGVCGSAGASAMNMSQLSFLFQQFLYAAQDTVLVAAAGNNVTQVSFPAAVNPVIAVGSFDFTSQVPLSAYTQVPVDRFVMAPGGTGVAGAAFAQRVGYSKASFMYGTSFATAFVSGFAAKVVCAREWSPCGTPIRTQAPTHAAAVLDEIRARSATNWGGFDVNKHGLGALQF